MIEVSEFPDEVGVLCNAAEAKLRLAEHMAEEGVLDWSDEDEALLLAWRKVASSTGEWEWWGREIGGDLYDYFGDTRAQVIAAARAELGHDASFEIVEACNWHDDIRVEEAGFAEIRNRSVVGPSGA